MITGRLVPNFTIEEMMCKDGSLVLSPDAVRHAQMLQEFRIWYNRPMTINSWYRSPEYNKRIGGSPKSKHMDCTATDFALPQTYFAMSKQRRSEFISNIKNKWAEICEKNNVGGGFGVYNTFLHLDSATRTIGKLTEWDERG